jgi:deoxyadenosine kinase
METSGLFIGMSGLIGAGKTTLARKLGKVMNLPVYEEPVQQNIYLEDFYRDMKKHGFAMQIYLLNERLAQHQRATWSGGGIQDRSIYEDSVFAKVLHESGFMDKRDHDTYTKLFDLCRNSMRDNDCIVHLDVPPEESLKRIKLRGRECEQGITLEYLISLKTHYEEFLNHISKRIPVIRVDWSNFRDEEEVAQKIYETVKSMKQIYSISWK